MDTLLHSELESANKRFKDAKGPFILDVRTRRGRGVDPKIRLICGGFCRPFAAIPVGPYIPLNPY